MAGEDKALVFDGVLVPELCGLAVEWARAVMLLVHHSERLLKDKYSTHLFGSPNKLCRLSKTVVML